jgi:hypothetical protein
MWISKTFYNHLNSMMYVHSPYGLKPFIPGPHFLDRRNFPSLQGPKRVFRKAWHSRIPCFKLGMVMNSKPNG